MAWDDDYTGNDIESALSFILGADTDVAALVSTRCYPIFAPQKPALPYIVYTVLDNDHVQSMTGLSGLASPMIRFDCFASTCDGADVLSEAVKIALTAYVGTVGTVEINGILLVDDNDAFESPVSGESVGMYCVSMNFTAWWSEAIA